MASDLHPPSSFTFDGNLPSKWSLWKKQFEWYLKATRKNKDDKDVLVGVLLTLLGHEGLRIYETFAWTTAADAFKIAPVLVKFDTHFQPQKSQTFEPCKFLTRHQREGESCESFFLELQSPRVSMIHNVILRDQIVFGVADMKTREKLLFDPQLSLNKAIEILRACETRR